MTAKNVQELISRFRERFGNRATTAQPVLEQHSRDESYHRSRVPDVVIFPQSTEEVSEIVCLCGAGRAPVIPWGAGTSLEGNAMPVQGGVLLDLSEMRRVIAINQEDFTVMVEAGVHRKQLNADLRHTGLWFTVDPGADATIGGMTATRASGTTAIKYGTMRSNVLNCTVVLANGKVIKTATRAPKSSAGYDLTSLFVGSEGTLGVITEITLRLHPVPETVTAVVCPFPDAMSAISAVTTAIQTAIDLARIEFLDERLMAAINRFQQSSYDEKFTLFVELHGSASSVQEQLTTFRDIATSCGAISIKAATTPEQRSLLWRARHDALYAAKALQPGRQCLITDVCVPVSRLAMCIQETRAELDRSRLVSTLVGHVGDGNFHAFILVDPVSTRDIREAERLHENMARRAIIHGGTCTGEHGIGVGKRELLKEELGEAVQAMRLIKGALDPHNIMNPGKIFD